MSRIAVVGMACRYPDANSAEQLWENILAGRRAFRRLPPERMRLSDYWSADPAAPDRFYSQTAAVLRDYEFDRVAFRLAGSTYRSTDLTHWLALEVAAEALRDAGFPDGERLPRERTGVVVGNSLTGEFARANLMRLRWPYVRRTLAAALREEGWDDAQLDRFLGDLEERYKSPFPSIDEDSLAGGLSNTIAGRICNHFDLKGGGYTVDGACSSSLLSVATACRSLRDGEIDVAIAGGVDLSIDPFEIVGFAKTGALATGEMRVYDRNSSGFWPGEGSGMLVLMREQDAVAAGRRSYASIAGFGISSDGKGGITRPEIPGYLLAVRRAYTQAGFGADTVELFEGHGTGTPVGNDTELRALSQARRQADPSRHPAAIGSIKAMIGHTKAAAGVAGLIKATLAVHHGVLPPTVGCQDPHPVLREEQPALRVLETAEPWPERSQLRAGVTAMGFGGINTHVVVEGPAPRRRPRLSARASRMARLAAGDGAELLVLAADDPVRLREQAANLAGFVGQVSYAELGDLAVHQQREVRHRRFRAAVVARNPQEAEQRLRQVMTVLDQPPGPLRQIGPGAFVGEAVEFARIGYLFPGQGSGERVDGGALRRRFPEADEAYLQAAIPAGDVVDTSVAQPRIVTGSLAGIRVLCGLDIDATVAVGHSLGELTALHWAGSFDSSALQRLATARGESMAVASRPGTMASVAAAPEPVTKLLAGTDVVIACYNGSEQTVVAGAPEAVSVVLERARAAGLAASLLPVSHAFHSPLVAPAVTGLATALSAEVLGPVKQPVVSTVTGARLAPEDDLPGLLKRQLTEPVRFTQAVREAAAEVDLFIEVGPGAVLSRLAAANTGVPAVAIDTDSDSLVPLLAAVGAAFVVGVPVQFDLLATGRPDREISVDTPLRFLASPCELAPAEQASPEPVPAVRETAGSATTSEPGSTSVSVSEAGPALEAGSGQPADVDTMSLLRELVSSRAELPPEAVAEESRLLDDLHLSSITVGQVLGQAAAKLGLPAGQAPTSFATATVKELAAALDELRETAHDGETVTPAVAGVAGWNRPFRISLEPAPALVETSGTEPAGSWQVYASAGHPLAEPLRQRLSDAGLGGGVLVCLPPACSRSDLELALRGAQAAIGLPEGSRLVLVNQGRGATAIAKTARLEAPHLRVTVVHAPSTGDPVSAVVAEVLDTTGFREVHLDTDGSRRRPVLRPVLPQPATAPLGAGDVLLVTGGGKGITAECALSLATDSGAKLAILGRSTPGQDPELAENLARMAQAGVTVRYFAADVTDPAAVQAAITSASSQLGPVTAVLHGAGRNRPAALSGLDAAELERTMAPKLDGLASVLEALAATGGPPRLLVTFGSIIGRAGLRGEAHYAVANEWLADATVEANRRYPGCRAVCLEWSVWSGAGMGERLSVVESLSREGISPITVERGVAVLRDMLADPDLPSVVVVTGRADGIETIEYGSQSLPLRRFVDKPLVHYPGVELVVQTRLTADTDPYLKDHFLDGNLLFPAVLGMEAMAQVASALLAEATGSKSGSASADEPAVGPSIEFESMEFQRPIVVPPGSETTIRVAALVRGLDTAQVAIRSSETGFGADHFRATVRLGAEPPPSSQRDQDSVTPEGSPDPAASPVPLNPDRDLYGSILFQTGRFQRLLRYQEVAATRATAEVASRAEPWFAAYLPGNLVTGDPGARDAYMHGIQVCVPHATLLPSGVRRLWLAPQPAPAGQRLSFTATERGRDGDVYDYDLEVRDAGGVLLEWWEGLRLHAVRKGDGAGAWAPPLLGPYLQRQLGDLFGLEVAVVVEQDDGSGRRASTARAVRRASAGGVTLRYRPDGRPELSGGRAVSSSHGAGMTLVVVAEFPVGCDLEPVAARSVREWEDLLGPHHRLVELLVRDAGESVERAATRVWCALESLQKLGEPRDTPLTVQSHPAPGWSVFGSGGLRVATFVAQVTGSDSPVVLTVAAQEAN